MTPTLERGQDQIFCFNCCVIELVKETFFGVLKLDNNSALVLYAESWLEAIEFARSQPQYVFRGQADSNWGLSTKIERVCEQNDFPTTGIRNRESTILMEFQRRAHHYITNPPPAAERLEWFSLIQHFGGPTRLLDFTHSFYVAAFFAMESASKDAAVWCLHDDYLYQHTDNHMQGHETIYDLHARSRVVIEENLANNHKGKLVMAAVPEKLNERISIQQGLFVVPGDVDFSFEENLAATIGVDASSLVSLHMEKAFPLKGALGGDACLDVPLVKIILPLEIHNGAIYDLTSMNITAATLFPGLEGFARSLNVYLRDVV